MISIFKEHITYEKLTHLLPLLSYLIN